MRDVHWTQRARQTREHRKQKATLVCAGTCPFLPQEGVCHCSSSPAGSTEAPVCKAQHCSQPGDTDSLQPVLMGAELLLPVPSQVTASILQKIFFSFPLSASSSTHSLLSRAPSQRNISNLMRGQITIPGIHTLQFVFPQGFLSFSFYYLWYENAGRGGVIRISKTEFLWHNTKEGRQPKEFLHKKWEMYLESKHLVF